MKDIIATIADHPRLSEEAKQRLIALALVLQSIAEEIVLKQEELHHE